MKSSTLPVLCMDAGAGSNVAFELLALSGFHGLSRCDATSVSFLEALSATRPMVIIADYGTPGLDIPAILEQIRAATPDSTLVVLFDQAQEQIVRYLCAMHEAAFVPKNCLWTLAPIVRRELQKVVEKTASTAQTSRLVKMNRAMHLQSGINCLVSGLHTGEELLREACNLIVSAGGYDAAIAAMKVDDQLMLQPVAWNGGNAGVVDDLRTCVGATSQDDPGIIGMVLRGEHEFACLDVAAIPPISELGGIMVRAELNSLVALPFRSEGGPTGVLVLAAGGDLKLDMQELGILRELVGTLSLAMSIIQGDIRIRFLSHYDSQTGLPKRALFKDRLAALLGEQGSGSRREVVVIDVERLSLINDSLGRRIVDLLLRQLSERLKRRWPSTDHIAHFGGGTFAWTVDVGASCDDAILADARQLAAWISEEPFRFEDREVSISLRSGFAVYPEDGRDADELIRKAEVALRNARGAGERHMRYDAGKHSRQIGELTIEHQLRRAIARQEFELHYQPKLGITSRRLEGLEALLRWRHPDGHLVMPSVFLPVLESTGLIVDVGKWVFQQAARDCQRWLQQGVPGVRVAINIAPAQLRDPAFVTDILAAVANWSTAECGFDLEITEGVFQDESPGDVQKLNQLRGHGARIAIDDFGTGYSSLSRISTLPVDVLKIDRAFVSQLSAGNAGGALVKTVIGFARAFNMLTVAEGVETQAQLEALSHLGCDQSQGFLHSAAIAAADCATMLRRESMRPMHEARAGRA